jgi:general secretion pathway protein A
MVLDYYNLKEQPFGVTPDAQYLYLGAAHREALASLSYGIRTGRGFMSLIAQPGMGKTTLLFQLLQQLQHSAKTVFLFQTLCGPEDLLRSILHDLGTDARGADIPTMHSRLNEHVVAESRRGRRLVVLIDEAQNLTDPALELLRMLSNFERTGAKLMQIILAGQPQLADKLASPNLVQLRQRISIVARLKPFGLEDTNLYVGHRLRVAGYDFAQPLFTSGAGAMIAEHSEGIPRNINNLCFNSLSLGYASKKKPIDEAVVQEVIDDLDLGTITVKEEAVVQSRRQSAFAHSRVGAGVVGYGPPSLFKCAAAAIFAVTLLWSLTAGDQIPKVLASQLSLAEKTSISSPLSAAPNNEPESQTIPVATQRAAKPTFIGDVLSKPLVGPRVVAPSLHDEKVARPGTDAVTAGIAPAELWEQVRKENTSAELALANLYLEGNVVPQNCLQARVLLSAASKKGKKAAESLLATYNERCE